MRPIRTTGRPVLAGRPAGVPVPASRRPNAGIVKPGGGITTRMGTPFTRERWPYVTEWRAAVVTILTARPDDWYGVAELEKLYAEAGYAPMTPTRWSDSLRLFHRAGWLERQRRTHPNRGGHRYVYRLKPNALASAEAFVAALGANR